MYADEGRRYHSTDNFDGKMRIDGNSGGKPYYVCLAVLPECRC